MVTLEQKIGAKLVFLMPKGVETFEIQAYVHQKYGFSIALVSDGETYHQAQIADSILEDILNFLYLLQNQNKDFEVWTQCHIVLKADKSVQFNFSKAAMSPFHERVFSQLEPLFEAEESGSHSDLLSDLSQVRTVEFTYHPTMLFALALDYATGLNGIDYDLEQSKMYFKSLTQSEPVSLAAYYNWVALECHANTYIEVDELEVLELFSRVRKSDAAALFVLGLMYHSGFKSLQPNIKLAMLYYRRSAALGCIQARLRSEDLYVGFLSSSTLKSNEPE